MHHIVWEDWDLICQPCKSSDSNEEGAAEEEDEEGECPKVLRDPGLPSKKEREKHKATHLPFRAWCAHCVRRGGRDVQSPAVKGEMAHSDVPRVHLDYCFFTEDSKDAKG